MTPSPESPIRSSREWHLTEMAKAEEEAKKEDEALQLQKDITIMEATLAKGGKEAEEPEEPKVFEKIRAASDEFPAAEGEELESEVDRAFQEVQTGGEEAGAENIIPFPGRDVAEEEKRASGGNAA